MNCTVSLSENGLNPADVEVLDRIYAWQTHNAECSSNFLGMFLADLVSAANGNGIDAVCTDPEMTKGLLRDAIASAEESLRIAAKVLGPFPNGRLEPRPKEQPATGAAA
jgi:hypothetical protein